MSAIMVITVHHCCTGADAANACSHYLPKQRTWWMSFLLSMKLQPSLKLCAPRLSVCHP